MQADRASKKIISIISSHPELLRKERELLMIPLQADGILKNHNDIINLSNSLLNEHLQKIYLQGNRAAT